MNTITGLRQTRTTCPYCGVGCGLVVDSIGAQIVGVRGDPDHPANLGRLCTKGSTLHLSLDPRSRLLQPQLRAARDLPLAPVSWDTALEHAANRFAQLVAEHGPDSVAFYLSGQLLTEDYYVFNKLARGLIGTNNIDTNSRLCMSSAVSGYKVTLGADAPPACYEDIELASCIFVAGANPAVAHPILFGRIEAARRANPALKLIVVDPRRTQSAQGADLHLPILPGTDVALFNGMLHVLLWEGLCDQGLIRDHTEGFDALKSLVAEYTPQAVASVCGVPAQDIVQTARWFAESRATLSLYCQGLNQSIQGTEKNAALINLHLATGQIGKPGAGPLSLTGQPNAMGGREVGGMATLLSAHRDPGDPADRAEVARLWGVDAIPDRPGKTAVELFDALRDGTIKAVWIACTNPAHSLPDLGKVAQALKQAQFVVVQDAFHTTETTPYADLLLPATTWGEKQGTVTNSERRISRVRAAVPAPGEARADWRIACDFALKLAPRLGKDGARLFPYVQPEAIFDEHRESTRGRDLDITGLSYALLEARGPQQWPMPAGASAGTARLYEGHLFPTASGRARFVAAPHRALAEATDARFPLHLITGRLRDQWHGMSRTGTVARLFNHEEEPLLGMSVADMQRRGLATGDLAQVKSRRGALIVRVRADETLRPAQAWLPMHWGARFMNGGGSNALTLAALDPISRQPELKHMAVQVAKVQLPWQLVLLRSGDALRYLEAMRPFLSRFAYATCGLYGRERTLMVFRAAAERAAPAELIEALDVAAELDDPAATLQYRDPRRGIAKRVLIRDGSVAGARLTGETAARDWLKEMIAAGAPADALRAWVLAPLNRAPQGSPPRGRILCACNDVAESEVRARAGVPLDQVQQELGCGTGCGSCLPEVKRLLSLPAVVEAPA